MSTFYKIKSILKPYYLPTLHKVKYISNNLIFRKNGAYVLLKINEILVREKIMFWLDFGTLLGIYRDGKLIKNDIDIDIAIFYSDYADKTKEVLTKNGFKFIRRLETTKDDCQCLEETYRMKNINVDIFYYHTKEEFAFCHLFPLNANGTRDVREIRMSKFKLTKITFLDNIFYIPDNTELRLKETYGDQWQIPDKNWYTPDDAYNSRLYNNLEVKEIC